MAARVIVQHDTTSAHSATMRTVLLAAFVAAVPPLLAQSTTAPASPPAPVRVAIKAAHLIDPRGQGRRIDDAVVLVSGDTVVQVGSRLTVPNGYQVIDLGAATVVPGLIDVHTHLTSQQADYYEGLFRRSASRSRRPRTRNGRSTPVSPRCGTWAPRS